MSDVSMGVEMPPQDAVAEEAPAVEASQVICTVLFNSEDGTFTLYHGDEPEGGREMGAMPDESTSQPEAEHYDSVSDLMRAVLECVRHAEEGGGSEGQFEQGYRGEVEEG